MSEISGNECNVFYNKSIKRYLNTNDSVDKKRFRDNEDMDLDNSLDNYYSNGSTYDTEEECTEEEEQWTEISDFDRMLLNVSNALINFNMNFEIQTIEWPEFDTIPPTPQYPTDKSKDCIQSDKKFPPEVGEVIFGYSLDELVCVGKRSAVFVGHNTRPGKSDQKLILKIAIESGFYCLQDECKHYLKLCDIQSIPKLLDFIWWRQYREDYTSVRWGMNIVENYGPNLLEVMKRSAKGVIEPMERVFEFGIQMIEIIENIHKNGLIHCSLKPENFLIGNETNPKLKLIGISAAKHYLMTSPNGTEEHITEKIDRKLPKGDPNFHSIGYHNGFRRSRRDDMESLGYCIVFMIKGTLPWINRKDTNLSSAKTIHRIGQRMQSTSIQVLCEGLPQPFTKYFDLISAYKFQDKPDYEALRQCFRPNVLFNN